MEPIRTYLHDQTIPVDGALSEQVARRARMYSLVDGVLYRRGAHEVLMKCITRMQGKELLEEIHGGVCGAHASF